MPAAGSEGVSSIQQEHWRLTLNPLRLQWHQERQSACFPATTEYQALVEASNYCALCVCRKSIAKTGPGFGYGFIVAWAFVMSFFTLLCGLIMEGFTQTVETQLTAGGVNRAEQPNAFAAVAVESRCAAAAADNLGDALPAALVRLMVIRHSQLSHAILHATLVAAR